MYLVPVDILGYSLPGILSSRRSSCILALNWTI